MVTVNKVEHDVEASQTCDKCPKSKQIVSVGMTKTKGMHAIWICKGCGFIEISNVDPPVVLRPPTEDELRGIMRPGLLANVIRVMQQNARLGPAPGCDCPACQAMKPTTINITTEPPQLVHVEKIVPAIHVDPVVSQRRRLFWRVFLWFALWQAAIAALFWVLEIPS